MNLEECSIRSVNRRIYILLINHRQLKFERRLVSVT